MLRPWGAGMNDRESLLSRLLKSLQKRPAVPIVLFLGVGISLQDIAPAAPWWWLGISFLSLIAAIAFLKREILSGIAIAIAIVGIGLTAAQVRQFQYPANHIWAYTDDGQRFAQIDVALDETPRLISPLSEQRSIPPKQVALAEVRQIRAVDGWQSATGQISLSLGDLNPQLQAGQIVRITGMLERPMPPDNPGQFDWAAYYREQRILANVHVLHADGVQVLENYGPSPLAWLRERTRDLLAVGFPSSQLLDHALLRAFLLGDSDPQLRDVQDEFAHTGMIHEISISGLHIAILGGMVLLACRLFRRSPRFSIILAGSVVLLYAAVALPSWPGVRSTIMCLAAAWGILWRRPLDSLQLLAMAVAMVLLIHPSDLQNAGFQISFAAVLGLILFSQRTGNLWWNWWRGPDAAALAIEARQKHRPIIDGARSVGRFIISALIAGLIAWMMAMPLVAYHFGQLNPWSVPASVAMLPLTVLALVMGALKIVLTLGWPSAAGFWAMLAGAPIHWMRLSIDWIDHLPGASVPMSAPTIKELAIFYGLVALALIPWKHWPTRWLGRLAPVAACVGLFVWPAQANTFSSPSQSASPQSISSAESRPQIHLTLLSIGAGQTGVLRLPNNHAVLFDVGSSDDSDVMRHTLNPYLQYEICNTIDRVFLSHGDFDHISAAADVFHFYNQPEFLLTPHFARHAVGNVPAENLLETFELANFSPTLIHRGQTIDLGGGAIIDVLWPPIDCDMNSNNCGEVVKLHYAGKTILFTADIQEPPERELMKDPQQLKADILIAPHHGSAETTTAAFIADIHPQLILASNARKLTHKQKTFDGLAKGYPFYRTSQFGAVTVSIDDDGKIAIETFKNPDPAATNSNAD
jgi:competence protein ComEC